MRSSEIELLMIRVKSHLGEVSGENFKNMKIVRQLDIVRPKNLSKFSEYPISRAFKHYKQIKCPKIVKKDGRKLLRNCCFLGFSKFWRP